MSYSAALSIFFMGLAVGLGSAGCYQANNNYDADAPQACSVSDPSSCPEATPVCDQEKKVCVQCSTTMADACKGDTPVCGEDRSCRACSQHSECPSGACLPSGACALESDVAYVQGGRTSTDSSCPRSMPCGTVWLGVLANKPVVKVATGLVKGGDVTLIERTVTIVGDPGAQLDRDGDGPIFTVQGKSGPSVKVVISGVEVTGSSMGDAITLVANSGQVATLVLDRVSVTNNQGTGVVASAGTLHVLRSKLSDNSNGGISIVGITAFQIVGNFFFNNGGPAKLFGGVSVATVGNPENRLDFNSFHKNLAQDGVGSAISCTAGTFTARNNILFGNTTGSNMLQASGTCAHTYSIIAPGPLPTGSFNLTDDPKFAGGGSNDLRLTENSPARGKADPEADLSGSARIDINGDLRVKPADIGADQFSKP